jgi:hypothetical protein
MTTIEERQRQRFRFLEAVYRLTDGQRLVQVPLDVIEPAIGLSHEEADPVFDYLLQQGLVETHLGASQVELTQQGILEYEAASTRPTQPTAHFPPNIINVHTMIGSQIQQATVHSSQELTQTLNVEQQSAVKAWLADVRAATHGLDPDSRGEVDAQLSTIDAQLKTRRPSLATIRAAAQAILPWLTAAADAANLIDKAHKLFG